MEKIAAGQAVASTDGGQSSGIGDGRQALVTAGIDNDDLAGRNVIVADEVVTGGLRVGQDSSRRAGVVAGRPAQVGVLESGVGLGVVEVAQVVDGHDAAAGMDQRQN